MNRTFLGGRWVALHTLHVNDPIMSTPFHGRWIDEHGGATPVTSQDEAVTSRRWTDTFEGGQPHHHSLDAVDLLAPATGGSPREAYGLAGPRPLHPRCPRRNDHVRILPHQQQLHEPDELHLHAERRQLALVGALGDLSPAD